MPRIMFEVIAVLIVFSIISLYFYFDGDVNSLNSILALFAVSLIRLIPAFTNYVLSDLLYEICKN